MEDVEAGEACAVCPMCVEDPCRIGSKDWCKDCGAITALIQEAVNEGRVAELKQIEPPEQYEDYARLAGREDCAICGFNAVKFRTHIKDRIKSLNKEDK